MYVVITGASSGFGAQFARQFGKLGYNMCLAARREDKLLSLKEEIERDYSVDVYICCVDLSNDKGVNDLYNFTKNKDVDILVNNAGVAVGEMPDSVEIIDELTMLDINVRALHYLTRLYLNDMLIKNSGKILNVSSLSAWLPVPLLSSYSAGKSYILHLSEGINFELKKMKSNVRISVVTPGFFNTEIAGKDKYIAKQNRSIPKFIEKVVMQFLNGKEIIIIGRDKQIFILTQFVKRSVAKAYLYIKVIQNIKKE